MVFVIACNSCESTNLKNYVGKMAEKGYDWFTCKDCKHNFTLAKASYIDY